jgi:hypothetical protein
VSDAVKHHSLDAVLLAAANVVGYLALFVLSVYLLRLMQRDGRVGPFKAAALGLVIDYAVVTLWYALTMYALDSYPHGQEPVWLDASSGIAENIQSEVIQVWLASLFFANLRWPGSPESK